MADKIFVLHILQKAIFADCWPVHWIAKEEFIATVQQHFNLNALKMLKLGKQ